jgi:DNA-binding NtrC family response regulator
VLQEGVFTPVGGTQPKQVDVRVIAATHKDLGVMVKKSEFREDLFYRINVIRIQVPPLRDRKDDLPVLIDHFMRKHKREGQRARALANDAIAVMQSYHWPGNIRELENEIERLLVLGSDSEIIPADLISSRIRDAVSGAAGSNVIGASRIAQLPLGRLNDAVEQLERDMIAQGLTRTKGNKSRLARELGISRSNLILKIQKYALEKPGQTVAEDEPEEPEAAL